MNKLILPRQTLCTNPASQPTDQLNTCSNTLDTIRCWYCIGTGGEGQHANSIFSHAGLVKADDVGQIDGHQAYYQSHTVLGHEFVDTSHIILGETPDAPVHAVSDAFSHPTSDPDHGTHGAAIASHETALHTGAGHDASGQVCLLHHCL